MKSHRQAALVAELCLAEGRPLAPELASLNRAAGAEAAAGALPRALVRLSLPPLVRKVAVLWPAATRRASRALAALPGRWSLTLPLWISTAYLWFVLALQWVVYTVLQMKVVPVLVKMGEDFDHAFMPFDGAYAIVFLFLLMPVLVLAGLSVIATTRLPGWARHLERAKEAAVARELMSSGAPAETVHRWLRESATLRNLTGQIRADDFDAISAHSAMAAHRAVERVVTVVRLAGMAFLVLGGLVIALSILSFTGRLAMLK